MATNQGNIGLHAGQQRIALHGQQFRQPGQPEYFNDTKCHRLTTAADLGVLQCGDPKGDGTGGPGYQFANEYPTDQYPPNDPKLQQPVLYPRGTLAMANAGPGTNGSQFFLVYKDSQLPPQYTVFGTIQADGLATLDKIAKARRRRRRRRRQARHRGDHQVGAARLAGSVSRPRTSPGRRRRRLRRCAPR